MVLLTYNLRAVPATPKATLYNVIKKRLNDIFKHLKETEAASN